MPSPSCETTEQFLRGHHNPYDLLLDAESPSLLDLGAGDLSFAEEVTTHYLPRLRQQQKTLTLHCVDRLQPGSRFGGPLHAPPQRLKMLRSQEELRFKFWGGQDMFEAVNLNTALPHYTLVTCHAPANPTFAYEPARVSRAAIERHLRSARGEYRVVREDGEKALEVLHGGRALLFPPWKFEIRGPLPLLDLMRRRASVVVLSAMDQDVFWEVLSQVVADPLARPRDTILTPALLPGLFGDVYAKLTALPIGSPVSLADLTRLRDDIPAVLDAAGASYRFRYVEVWRGAVFGGLPAGQTARRFGSMKDEAPPWMLVMVPDA
ncbi:MAG TPA: hypothetical protein VGA17_10015 [Nitrospiraceae bacterium]|jgi:hypothetical protein